MIDGQSPTQLGPKKSHKSEKPLTIWYRILCIHQLCVVVGWCWITDACFCTFGYARHALYPAHSNSIGFVCPTICLLHLHQFPSLAIMQRKADRILVQLYIKTGYTCGLLYGCLRMHFSRSRCPCRILWATDIAHFSQQGMNRQPQITSLAYHSSLYIFVPRVGNV